MHLNADITGEAQPQHRHMIAKGGDALAKAEGQKEQSAGNCADKYHQQDKAQIKNCRPKSAPELSHPQYKQVSEPYFDGASCEISATLINSCRKLNKRAKRLSRMA